MSQAVLEVGENHVHRQPRESNSPAQEWTPLANPAPTGPVLIGVNQKQDWLVAFQDLQHEASVWDLRSGQVHPLTGIDFGGQMPPFWNSDTEILHFRDDQGIEWDLPLRQIPEYLRPEGRARLLAEHLLGGPDASPAGSIRLEGGRVTVNGLSLPPRPRPK